MRKFLKPLLLLAAALALGVGGPTVAVASSEGDGANNDLATQVDNANVGEQGQEGVDEPDATNNDLATQVDNENADEQGDDEGDLSDAATGPTGQAGPQGDHSHD
jgi:hypothetical protein